MIEKKLIRNVLYRTTNFNRSDGTFTYLLDPTKSDRVKLKKMLSKRSNKGDTPFNKTVRDGKLNETKPIIEGRV